MTAKEHKILMLCIPLAGHFYPFACFASELAKRKNVKIIMYGNKEFEPIVERTNIEFRNVEVDNWSKNVDVLECRKNFPVHKLLYSYMKATDKILPELVRCVQEEEIDLVIYDFMTVYAKWFLMYLKRQHKRAGQLKLNNSRPLPKTMMFCASIMYQRNVYPNAFEEKFAVQPVFNLSYCINMLFFLPKYAYFCLIKYQLPMHNPTDLVFYTQDDLNICCLVPEFQPRSHLFTGNFWFVGSCVAEDIRSETVFSEPLKSFLEPYPAKNPLALSNMRVRDEDLNSQKKLVYVSLGTIVNTYIQSYLTIIEAIKLINDESTSTVLKSYDFILSVGSISEAKFKSMVEKSELKVPENVLILPKVPQLDILKRASLFITHSGQGSTSESIHYGVPMVCIPVMGDQPEVAYRATDELGLGIQLDFDSLKPVDVKNAVVKILNDKSYLERTLVFSQISRKYNGTANATQLTIEFLQSSALKISHF